MVPPPMRRSRDRREGAVLFTNGDHGFQMIPATALLFDGTDLAAFALSKR